MRRKKITPDMLKQKQSELNGYVVQADDAVSAITDAMNNLETINSDIDQKIQEIDDYQNQLASTREGLDKARIRNQKIAKNFRQLLEVD
jgi:predicted  nucleic acid-binding Zn-ribbon protein